MEKDYVIIQVLNGNFSLADFPKTVEVFGAEVILEVLLTAVRESCLIHFNSK